jgi:DNA-binding CsgD family transcriptional regulator
MRFPLPKVRWCLAHGAVRISAGDLHAWVQKGSSVGAGRRLANRVAALFSGLGIWLGLKLTRTRETVVVREVPVPVEAQVPVHVFGPFVRNETKLQQLGITPRELEILEALASGASNREIAGRLNVSENTVKTHTSRVFDKLAARRRTQAVQRAKEAGLIP